MTRADKVVVLHQGALGDFVLALTVVQAVRSHLRADQVIAVASAPSARLAAGRSAIDVHRLPDAVGLHTLFRESGPLDNRLGSLLGGADRVLSFLGDAASTTHERLASATTAGVVSIDPRPSEETLTSRQHITTQWRTAARQQGLAIDVLDGPRIHLETGSRGARSDDEIHRIVIHPGSGGRGKCWPLDRFVQLIQSMDPVDIMWMLGPTERESDERFTMLYERAGRGESVVLEEDLLQAARHIATADLYIGNDAGPGHLAAAMSVPTIAIFGPTDPRVWQPLGDQVTVIAAGKPGTPITAVTVEQVRDVVERVTSRRLPL